ncbi:MAG: hypothetical protein K9J37_07155 [Saprospiraceae bacterium]|nr:hypothetical protein [Saprospiraceae bacterium]MCF8249674.1 hypothetical protein [Saprospiraceae bacterium]MCF8279832.1 hypothetical protein [Bacteroidales bacterium]MCF8312339.1 hypothetical protein [Saprospiraceae bacterium]MCF8440664.1 hypothetical protein [Saprospiraceae bacterium]
MGDEGGEVKLVSIEAIAELKSVYVKIIIASQIFILKIYEIMNRTSWEGESKKWQKKNRALPTRAMHDFLLQGKQVTA